MANSPNTYFDPATIIVRESETDNALGPNFSSNGGMTYGSCQPGIGIATDQPNLTGDANQWTLLDQDGAARTPQNSQYIGDVMTPALIVANTTEGNVDSPANATLATLAAGWTGA